MPERYMKRLQAIVILIFGNIIVAALLPAVEQPMRTIFYIGLSIADILALFAIIKGSSGNSFFLYQLQLNRTL